MKRLVLLSILALVAACATPTAPSLLPDVRGEWNYWSIAFAPADANVGPCQIVGTLLIETQRGERIAGSFAGIRGCDGPYPDYVAVVSGTITADSVFFVLGDTEQRGNWRATRDALGGALHLTHAGFPFEGRWTAEPR